ncbi:hypothetical protein TIFTF001_025314 [Ficus carica]|uniref:Uncharacterized protein n=1 Tax=Ficus carica TaxID=3494 RepID=A0AA88B1B4_FICCA|nr:hypothetical protein TIFTF001_025314 [Ficus carica]
MKNDLVYDSFLADERRHFVTLFFSSFKPNHFPSRFLLPPPCLRVHTATVRAGDLQMGLAFPRLLQYLSITDVFTSVGVAKNGVAVMAAE